MAPPDAPVHAYRIEHHRAGATVALGFSNATGALADILSADATRLLAARVPGVLTLVEQATESIVAYRPLWPENGEAEDASDAGEPPIAATFPLTFGGVTYSRDEILARCADVLVEAALNREVAVDPDPTAAGPLHNARGFAVLGLDAPPASCVRLAPADLVEVIGRAREELLRTLGYLPRGRKPSA